MVQRHDHPDIERVKQTLAAITISEARLRQVTADCAITFWISATTESEPQHRGVSTIFHGGSGEQANVDIVVTNVSALALLNDSCRQANLVWWLTPKCLMIAPRNEKDAEQRATPLPPAPQAGPAEGAR